MLLEGWAGHWCLLCLLIYIKSVVWYTALVKDAAVEWVLAAVSSICILQCFGSAKGMLSRYLTPFAVVSLPFSLKVFQLPSCSAAEPCGYSDSVSPLASLPTIWTFSWCRLCCVPRTWMPRFSVCSSPSPTFRFFPQRVFSGCHGFDPFPGLLSCQCKKQHFSAGPFSWDHSSHQMPLGAPLYWALFQAAVQGQVFVYENACLRNPDTFYGNTQTD